MFIEVRAFDDMKREFIVKSIKKENVNAYDPDVVVMYGPHGERACVKVFMVGYWFWMSAEDVTLIGPTTA